MKTLAIETSCDDTSLALVRYEDGEFFVDELKAYSQIADHQQYGGVVPEVAFRLHSEQILALVKHFPEEALQHVDCMSVTTHPGLAGSLLVGKTVAHMLGHHFDKSIISVNHIYGHIFSLLLQRKVDELHFPWIVLTASGGHNEIYLVQNKTQKAGSKNSRKDSLPYTIDDLEITKLGKTLDDAAGECFDKVARMLGGPYPGGARIGQQAMLGKPNSAYRFGRILLKDHPNPYDFSFSGMKAQTYNLVQKLEKEGVVIEGEVLHDIAYEFQEAIVDVLIYKLLAAVQEYGAETVGIVGGVSANDRLFEEASKRILQATGKQVLRPTKKVYSTDNGAMIGVVGLLSQNNINDY